MCYHYYFFFNCSISGGTSVTRLQRPVDERDGVCGDDLPTGVHVSSHSSSTYLYGIGRAGKTIWILEFGFVFEFQNVKYI